jgi:membrane associated rhomboid family serine protease
MTDETKPPREPFFNIAPATGALVVAFIFLHLFRVVEPYPIERLIIDRYGFVPHDFVRDPLAHLYRLITYAGLHGNVMHVAINGAGLLAFGTGVERALGRRTLLSVLMIGVVAGVLGHSLMFPHSDVPLIGLSAGVSALFGAMMWVWNGRRGIVAVTLMFILTNILVGVMGVPNEPGLAIAWQAHIVGFLAGMLAAAFVTRRKGCSLS